MPEKVTAYRCKYRCGQRVNTKKESIRLHENMCFSNRERKACRTCVKWAHGKVDGAVRRICIDYHLKEDQFATYDCEYWEPK